MPVHTSKHALRVAELDTQNPTGFDLQITAKARKSIAARLDLPEISKLRFTGKLAPLNKADWSLTARLGTTVVQACVLTLAPVSARIDIGVERRFLADIPEQVETEEEIEIPADENSEPLGVDIDLFEIIVEALALALPLYPKAEGAVLQTGNITGPGKSAISDAGARPFASLAALRDKLKEGD